MSPIERQPVSKPSDWPALPHRDWADTLETLHMWTQVVGKVRMELSPWVNHSWSVPLYVTSRGLTTSPVPVGGRTFEIDFDFIDHRLPIRVSDGQTRTIALEPKTVAEFHHELMDALASMGIRVVIHTLPNEVPEPIRFEDDDVHGSYEIAHVEAFRRALIQSDRVLREFRASYTGKVSPVHFFWGSFDLAVTRFSGRTAPAHPGGIPHLPDEITREAYSHEVTSCGFWPGNREAPEPIYYAYAYPTPDGFSRAEVRPAEAFWHADLSEFVLPYEAVRSADSPDDAVFAFCESTHAAGADLLDWKRDGVEWQRGYRPLPRARD